jgi:hypothetical protein
MKTIYKYPLTTGDSVTIYLPKGAEVLTVQTQAGLPCVWAKVDTASMSEFHRFYVRGTGHELTGNEGAYVGTFQVYDGELVFHLFEAKTEQAY